MSPTRFFLLALCTSFALAGPARAQAPAAAVTPVAAQATAPGLNALDQFNFLGRAAGYVRTDKFLQFVSNAESGVKEKGMFEGRGPLAILLLVFVGGLALNLTPCVLPM